MLLSQGPSCSLCRPLHLAIIHEQTAVIKQLIEVVVSIPSLDIINISNNLQQVHVSQSSWCSAWGSLPFQHPVLLLLSLKGGCRAEHSAAMVVRTLVQDSAPLVSNTEGCCCPTDTTASGSRHQAAPSGPAPAASPC